MNPGTGYTKIPLMEESRDKYGGCKSITFEPGGFFRLEQRGRWWLVTPEGHGFLSLGINHIEPGRLLANYNKGYWSKRLGIDPANEYRHFFPGIREKVLEDISLLGLNTIGGHNNEAIFAHKAFPYIKPVRFVHIQLPSTPSKEDFPDVFAPSFRSGCDAHAAATIAPLKNDPMLLGYTLTDCPILTALDAAPRINTIYSVKKSGVPTWPVVLRNLGGGDEGKKAYVDLMSVIYEDNISSFNQVYDTCFESFHELHMKPNWRPGVDYGNRQELRDNEQFLFKIVDRSYTVIVSSIRKYDNNHLIFGDTLNGNTDTPSEIVSLAGKHMDLVIYQYYAFQEEQEALLRKWSQATSKPFFMGDSSLSVPNLQMPDPFGPHCVSQEERATRTDSLLRYMLSQPNVVGWNWCGWMDSWKQLQPEKQHSGLQDPFGCFYEPMKRVFASISSDLYRIAAAKL